MSFGGPFRGGTSIVGGVWNLPDSLPLGADSGTVHVKLKGMKGNGLGVLGHIEVNHDSAVEGEVLEVGLESNMIVPWDDVGGEQLTSCHIDPTSHIGLGVSSAHVVTAV